VETSPQIRVVARRWTITLVAALAAAGAAAENTAAPGIDAPMALHFFIDRRLPQDLRPALDAAFRKLSDSRCQEVFADFSDVSGRRLDDNLAAIGQSPQTYLGLVLFYDGRATSPCANRSVLAWTNPGSRAVFVCWSQFATIQRWSVSYAANTIIHEALHTLGLGEGPPEPGQITARVAARCGN
jgi:hypothetical protein